MSIGRTNAGGGGGLNFKVVPGLTQPGTASENTIWVKTEKITSWIFSTTEPEAPEEGMVWFPTGTSSPVEFNAMKKNGIQVYPISAKQYVSGAWVSVTAVSYQAGEWVPLQFYFFKAGIGAMVPLKCNPEVGVSINYYTEITDEYIYVHPYGGQGYSSYAMFCTETKYDLSQFTMLYFDVEVETSVYTHSIMLGVTDVANDNINPSSVSFSAKAAVTKAQSRGIISVPIENVNSGYISVHACNGNIKIYNFWCE